MANVIAFTIFDVGCFGDGAAGHQHTRERCANQLAFLVRLLETLDNPNYAYIIRGAELLRKELLTEMSDDALEEADACELLNQFTASGCAWDWQDGDFGLWPKERPEHGDINQCDGCRRGLPVDDKGIHHDEQLMGMACTADRYKND